MGNINPKIIELKKKLGFGANDDKGFENAEWVDYSDSQLNEFIDAATKGKKVLKQKYSNGKFSQ